MEGTSLKEGVRRAARGDERAAAELFDHFYPRVFRYARAKLHNDSDAEDVAAETFARVLRGLDKFRWKGAGFEAWLFRIASNLVVDTVRASGREQPHEHVEPADAGEAAETTVLRAHDRAEALALMSVLPPDQQEVLALRFGADLDTHETGRVMRRSVNAVRQLQFRALQRLRDLTRAETRP